MIKTARDFFFDILKDNDACLAPMAGVCTPVFRGICAEYGASLTFSEMVSAAALVFGNKKTFTMLGISKKEHHPVLQIFAATPDEAQKAVEVHLNRTDFVSIDLNAGCPVRKILAAGAGSALLEDLPRLEAIVRAIVRVSMKPVSVKIRLGAGGKNVSIEAARRIEDAGAGMVTVHGRTREQMYSGSADREAIAAVVQTVGIPVCANGDVNSVHDYQSIKEETGAAGVLIGRGALGNPFLFRQIREMKKTGAPHIVSIREKKETIRCHLGGLVAEKGEKKGVEEFRKHFCWYTKGLSGAAKLRGIVNTAKSAEEVLALIDVLSEEVCL